MKYLFIFVVFVCPSVFAESVAQIIERAVEEGAANFNLGYIQISYDLRSSNIQGEARLYESGARSIHFHRCLARAQATTQQKYTFVRHLALHEVAHHIVWLTDSKNRGHGRRFREVMRSLGVQNEQRSLPGGFHGCPF